MTSVRHDDMTRFTSRGRQRHSKRSIQRRRLRGRKLHTLRGLGNGYQVQPELVTRAECIKVSWGAGIPKCTVTHVYTSPEPDLCYLLSVFRNFSMDISPSL